MCNGFANTSSSIACQHCLPKAESPSQPQLSEEQKEEWLKDCDEAWDYGYKKGLQDALTRLKAEHDKYCGKMDWFEIAKRKLNL